MDTPTIILFVIAVIGFAIAVTALVLAILWRNKTDTNESIPSVMGGQIVTLQPVTPNDVTFVPNTQINYTLVNTRQDAVTIATSIVLSCSSVFVTRTTGPMTDLTFSFTLNRPVVATAVDGQISFIGNGTNPETASPGPLAILQAPLIVNGTNTTTFTLHYTFGGGTVPANQQMQLNFQISWIFTTAG